MKILSIFIVLILTITLLVPQGCTNDKLVDDFMCDQNDRITYDDVRIILRESCGAQSTGCHVTGGIRPDYTNWNEEMLASLVPGRFEKRVVTNKDMPPDHAPESAELDSIDNYLIRCWIEGGYLEE